MTSSLDKRDGETGAFGTAFSPGDGVGDGFDWLLAFLLARSFLALDLLLSAARPLLYFAAGDFPVVVGVCRPDSCPALARAVAVVMLTTPP